MDGTADPPTPDSLHGGKEKSDETAVTVPVEEESSLTSIHSAGTKAKWTMMPLAAKKALINLTKQRVFDSAPYSATIAAVATAAISGWSSSPGSGPPAPVGSGKPGQQPGKERRPKSAKDPTTTRHEEEAASKCASGTDDPESKTACGGKPATPNSEDKEACSKRDSATQDHDMDTAAFGMDSFGPPVIVTRDNSSAAAEASGNAQDENGFDSASFGPPITYKDVAKGENTAPRRKAKIAIETTPAKNGGTSAKPKPAQQKTAPKIQIPKVRISDISLCDVRPPEQKQAEPERPEDLIHLNGWLEYNLHDSASHEPVSARDPRQCLDDSFNHLSLPAVVHSVRTRETTNNAKGFKTTFDILIKPKEQLEVDKYRVSKLCALDAEVYNIVQQKVWHVSDNEHSDALRFAFPSNNSTVDMPEFLMTCFCPETHGTSRPQLLDINGCLLPRSKSKATNVLPVRRCLGVEKKGWRTLGFLPLQ